MCTQRKLEARDRCFPYLELGFCDLGNVVFGLALERQTLYVMMSIL